jgi:hypothetical protein
MNLAWIAAVLSPFEVAPHPNYRTSSGHRREADLAAIVLGRIPDWASPVKRAIDPAVSSPADEGIRLVYESFYSEESQPKRDLASYLLDYPANEDPARRAALTLLGCAVAGIEDDFALCDNLIGTALSAIEGSDDDSKLCRAVLLQQLAFRRRDAGAPAVDTSVESALLLEQLDAAALSPFELNGVTPLTTPALMNRVIEALKHASWSTSDRDLFDPNGIGPIPSVKDQLFTDPAIELSRIERDAHSQYDRGIDIEFTRLFDRVPRTTLGGRAPDLFFEMLRYELYGHAGVAYERKQAAMMRSIQGYPSLTDATTSNSLRLLRQAVAETQLSQLVGHLEFCGPLTSIVNDAHRILANRRSPQAVRAVELVVLEAAADLLPEAEATEVLDLILSVMDAGGPFNPPGSWRVESKRFESVATAALSVGAATGSLGKVVDRLLDSVTPKRISDALWDRVYANIVRQIEWDNVPASVRVAWERLLHTPQLQISITTNVFDRNLPPEAENDWGSIDSYSLEQCVEIINRHIRHRDKIIPKDLSDRTATLSLARVNAIRAEAPGKYSHAVLDPADVMALLIVEADRYELWEPMLGFLSDINVPRTARRHSYDRLAFHKTHVDASTLARHRDALVAAVHSRDPFGAFEHQSGVIFPAAMRFAAVYGLLEPAKAFEYVWALSTSSNRFNRLDGVRSLKALAAGAPPAWVPVAALQLSYDPFPEVKREAIDLLGSLASAESPDLPSASERLRELLSEDGVAIPLAVLTAMSTYSLQDTRLRTEAKSLRAAHISRRIRLAAAALSG